MVNKESLTVISIGLLVTILLIGGVVWSQNLKKNKYTQEIEGVMVYERTDRTHTTEPVDYELSPPVGGPHNPEWVGCNVAVYTSPIEEERAVHALEHGAVWITHDPDLDQQSLEKLKSKVKSYTFMSPLNTQNANIVLTAWGHQLIVDSADDPRIDKFLSKFRQGLQTPEPGATCNVVPGGMMR